MFYLITAVITQISKLNVLQGYIKSNFPLGALTVKDEILRQGLKPDRLTYNTIISACVKSAEIDMAIRFLEDMKVSHKCWKGQFQPQKCFASAQNSLYNENELLTLQCRKKLKGIIILNSFQMLLPTQHYLRYDACQLILPVDSSSSVHVLAKNNS